MLTQSKTMAAGKVGVGGRVLERGNDILDIVVYAHPPRQTEHHVFCQVIPARRAEVQYIRVVAS